MPTVTINGQQVAVEAGTTIISAAEKIGVVIPHYCYHPGLSIAGSCRMCQVQIEGQRRLQIACNTPVTEGMIVQTESDWVQKARQTVLEFLLLNHPLDCPVCDQAGECGLQDYYMEYGRYQSRFYENKEKKQKALPIGPHVILDQERCILCSRCVRFCSEITKTHELGILNRGNHSAIDTFPGMELTNKYSGNVVDICPVGALTDRDFRFKCRVWYLEKGKSICPGCSTGCNIEVHYNLRRPYLANGERVMRLKPRYNEAVNQWWMCDEGRYGYKFIDAPDRLLEPYLRHGEGLASVDWDTASLQVTGQLKRILETYGPDSVGVIASPKLTNEDLYLVKKFFNEQLGVPHIDFKVPQAGEVSSDNFLMKADKNPNTLGAVKIGLSPQNGGFTVEEMLNAAKEGKLKALYIINHDLVASFGEERISEALSTLELVVLQLTNLNATARYAHAILPGAVYVERDGTFTNDQGRVQRISQILEPLGESLPAWKILLKLAEGMGVTYPYGTAGEIFKEISEKVTPFKELTYEGIGDQGMMLSGEVSHVD
ncbi:MAG: molybdopterin-dependent oxidoreductase [Candidatus Tectomicrobia bacterium]|nr:molybdopterin-dependent oxidoreductase [Candidatus Tectomicrobia bacterium]